METQYHNTQLHDQFVLEHDHCCEQQAPDEVVQGLQDNQAAPCQSQLTVEGTQPLSNAWSDKEVKILIQGGREHKWYHTTEAE